MSAGHIFSINCVIIFYAVNSPELCICKPDRSKWECRNYESHEGEIKEIMRDDYAFIRSLQL